MTSTTAETAAAFIDTAYFKGVEPFDGREDDPKSDVAATKIGVWPCSIPGWDVTLDIGRTNIRVDMSAEEARKLATLLIAAAKGEDTAPCLDCGRGISYIDEPWYPVDGGGVCISCGRGRGITDDPI